MWRTDIPLNSAGCSLRAWGALVARVPKAGLLADVPRARVGRSSKFGRTSVLVPSRPCARSTQMGRGGIVIPTRVLAARARVGRPAHAQDGTHTVPVKRVAGHCYSATASRGQLARDRLQDCVEHVEGDMLTVS
jgi:hypothetical protein